MTDTPALISEYTRNGSEPAFRELVTRYLDLVYSTALRLVEGDTHLAEDVAQMVFVDLARLARNLPKDVLLGGWLHRDTCFVAGKAMRSQRRRQARERQAAEMNALTDHSQNNLAQIAPVLDEALNQLGEADRMAILLRFFENRDFRSVGLALGSDEDTAQKRVSRALDKLSALLKHRGVSLSTAALATALGAGAVTAAPTGLAATIATSALASVAVGSGVTLTFIKAMALTKLKLGILGGLLVAGVAVPVLIQHRSNSVSAQADPALAESEPGHNSHSAGHTGQCGSGINVNLSANPVSPRIVPSKPAGDSALFRPMDEIVKGQRLSAEEAQALESKLAQEPQDLSARCQLLGYYSTRQYSSKSAREARQAHVLWFIQNQPELSLTSNAFLDPISDRSAYDEAKALWLEQTNRNPQNVAILANAAAFCLLHDRPLAEDLLKQAQALEPKNPVWSEQMAHLYELDANGVKAGAPNPAATRALQQMETAQANTTDELKRFYNLNSLAKMAFDAGEIEKAKEYATTMLQQAAEPRSGWDYGDAVYRGNSVLGRIAVRAGNLDQARQYLLASARTTGSPVLGSFGPNMTLARELLDQGDKETVLEYFKLCGAFWKDDKLNAWTEQVKQGWVPDFGANLVY